MRRTLLTTAGLAALLVGGLIVGDAGAAASTGYTAPVVAIPTAPGSTNTGAGTGGEPRLLVTEDGRILVAAHFSEWDCVTRQPSPGKGHQCVWLSRDGGRSFQIAGGELNQQGDDVDLAVSGGVLLESTMTNKGLGTGILGTTISRSTDGGRTWTETVAANSTLLNDRPFMLAVPDGGVVVTYDAIPGGIQLVRSTDHGATWGLPQSVAVPGGSGPAVALNGAPAIDRVHKQLLVPYAVGSSPTCTSGAAGCLNTISIARGGFDGTGWTSELALTLPEDMGSQSLVSAAADAAGTAYLTVGTARGATPTTGPDHAAHVQLATKDANGWQLHQVDPRGGSAMLPNLAAGAAGRVVVSYYWSPYADAQAVARPWYAVVADSHDGGRTFARTVISKVAWVGAAVDHQRTLWDLFGVAIDTKGKVHVAWTQVSAMTPTGPLTEIAYSRQR
jgi:hypothetical protein